MAAYLPRVPEFNSNDKWSFYLERLNQYFVAYAIEDDRKAALLLTAVTSDVYETISNACFPTKPADKTFDQLCAIFKTQFSPLFSVHAERYKFYEAKQEIGESITNWFARMKQLALNCEFGDKLDHSLKDKFICGMVKGPVLDKMFELKITDSLTECFEAALRRELTITHKQANIEEINALRKFSKNPKSNRGQSKAYKNNASAFSSSEEKKVCYSCGKSDHNFATCKYKTYTCSICNRVGHLPRVCSLHKSKRDKRNQYSNNFIENESTNEEQSESDNSNSDSDDEHFLYNLTDDKQNPFVIQLLVNGTSIEFEVDTGASLSVCSRKFYEERLSHLPVKKSNVILNSYDKSIIKPIGAVEISIEYNDEIIKSDILIIENGGKPLIGRDILRKMKVDRVCELNENPKFKAVLKKYENIFDKELGLYKYTKIKIEVKKDTKPIFLRPRRVPISMQDKVNCEIDRLVLEGVLRPIDTSDWGTPIVPILKKKRRNTNLCRL